MNCLVSYLKAIEIELEMTKKVPETGTFSINGNPCPVDAAASVCSK